MYLDEHAWGFAMLAVPAALLWTTVFALHASQPRSALLVLSVPAGLWLSLFGLADISVHFRAVLVVNMPTKLCTMYGLNPIINCRLCTFIDVCALIWVVFKLLVYLFVTYCYWLVRSRALTG
jgi:hypothetical protein